MVKYNTQTKHGNASIYTLGEKCHVCTAGMQHSSLSPSSPHEECALKGEERLAGDAEVIVTTKAKAYPAYPDNACVYILLKSFGQTIQFSQFVWMVRIHTDKQITFLNKRTRSLKVLSLFIIHLNPPMLDAFLS